MAYTRTNFKTKKALKEAVARGEEVLVFELMPGGSVTKNGEVCVEGPHYPEPHRWYAVVTLENGKVVCVK